MRKLWRRIYFLLHRERLERELAEEMDAHRAMMSADRRPHFGNSTRLREESREAWSWAWLEGLSQDVAYGIRMLWHAPGFTLGAAAVLALGVGVNVAEFQIFDVMIFHRFNFRDADAVLQFTHSSKQRPQLGFSAGAVEFYRKESRGFSWLVSEDSTVDIVLDGDAAVRTTMVSPNYFASLGILPAWGRLIDARDGEPGAPPVLVLSYDCWQTRYGGDPRVVGRVVHVNDRPFEVVGVTPYTFQGLMRVPSVWFPVAVRPLLITGSGPIEQDFSHASEVLFGKLQAGVGQAAGEAELTALTRELARRQPRAFAADERVHSDLIQNSMRALRTSAPVMIFFVMVLLVLLSACANLGNMLLARGLARQREIQIRIAVGAGRGRVVRQLMTENLLLAVIGCAAGLAFGAVSVRLLLRALNAPLWLRVSMSGEIVAAGAALTFLSAAIFGLPAALRTVRLDRRIRLRQGLVGVQVAVSCLLLIASGVLAHNGIRTASVDLAFDYRNMVSIYPQLYARGLTPAAAQQKLYAFSTRLGTLPGVDGVTLAVTPPLGGRIVADHLPGLPKVYRNIVAPSYFAVMNLPLLRGRTFLPGEQNSVIVSESAARAVWPNEDPVGKKWLLPGAERSVVGVVKDSGANLVADADSIEAYVPLEGTNVERAALILHVAGDPALVVHMIPGAASALNETVVVDLMRASRENLLQSQRRMITMIGSIGAVATALAAAGMFALVAFAVAQRRREIGIRMAIGATARHILAVLLGQNAKATAIGMAAGAIMAVILSRLVASLVVLQKQELVDVAGFAGGLLGFALVAVLAALSPARHALRIDPATTLREE
jgi:predicted permease